MMMAIAEELEGKEKDEENRLEQKQSQKRGLQSGYIT
jgi:hypothetical protein